MKDIDVDAYLKRIDYLGPLQPNEHSLKALHLAHLQSVPFENLDIHLGRPIRMDPAALFDKIVRQRRGGFCYELNGLFASLLQALGYRVTYLSARDAHEDGSYGPEFDHLTLIVHLTSGPWLADVGWGDTFTVPLQLENRYIQADGRRAYRLEPVDDDLLLWQRHGDGRWERNYRFSLQPRRFSDFEPMCVYHQTSPDSMFTRKRLCTMAAPRGRVTLSDMRFIQTVDGRREEYPIPDERVYRKLLRQHFGIDLPQGLKFSQPA